MEVWQLFSFTLFTPFTLFLAIIFQNPKTYPQSNLHDWGFVFGLTTIASQLRTIDTLN